MKTIPDFIEFIVSLLLLVVLSFTLLAFGVEALALQLMIFVAVIGDVALYCLYRD